VLADGAGVREGAAFELVVDAVHRWAQVPPGTTREAEHGVLRDVAGVLDLEAGLPRPGRVEVSARLSERPF